MIKKKTLFVVGAGASAEFGLPVGSELQNQIARLVDIRFRNGIDMISGDGQVYEIARRQFQEGRNAYLQAGRWIGEAIALSNSIDNFMDVHSADKHVRVMGCLAIAKAIAKAERSSKLYFDWRNNNNEIAFDALVATWLPKLFRYMQEGRRKEDVEQFFDSVSFVVFNYDRCIEHFFFRALRKFYAITDGRAAEVVGGANIVHPYGTIGLLPWQTQQPDGVVEFGADECPLWEMAQRIRTYTDQVDDQTTLDRIRAMIADAEIICFLGFSYQAQNMTLLMPETQTTPGTAIGTAYDISDFNVQQIKSEIAKGLGRSAHLDNGRADGKCAAFLDKYSRAFA